FTRSSPGSAGVPDTVGKWSGPRIGLSPACRSAGRARRSCPWHRPAGTGAQRRRGRTPAIMRALSAIQIRQQYRPRLELPDAGGDDTAGELVSVSRATEAGEERSDGGRAPGATE